jgi:hypothetical protein
LTHNTGAQARSGTAGSQGRDSDGQGGGEESRRRIRKGSRRGQGAGGAGESGGTGEEEGAGTGGGEGAAESDGAKGRVGPACCTDPRIVWGLYCRAVQSVFASMM